MRFGRAVRDCRGPRFANHFHQKYRVLVTSAVKIYIKNNVKIDLQPLVFGIITYEDYAQSASITPSPWLYKAHFIRRILVASNAIKIIDNEMINLIKLHYLLFELHSTRLKFDV